MASPGQRRRHFPQEMRRPRAPLDGALGDSPEENESTRLFGSIRSGRILDIGQASTDASWGILARLFFLAGASGAACRGHARDGDRRTAKEKHVPQHVPLSSRRRRVRHGGQLRRSPAGDALARIEQDRSRTQLCKRGDGRGSALATGTNRGEPPLGGGRGICRLAHDPIFARHKFPSRATGSFIRSRGAWT
jgi:hypothetical protein